MADADPNSHAPDGTPLAIEYIVVAPSAKKKSRVRLILDVISLVAARPRGNLRLGLRASSIGRGEDAYSVYCVVRACGCSSHSPQMSVYSSYTAPTKITPGGTPGRQTAYTIHSQQSPGA